MFELIVRVAVVEEPDERVAVPGVKETVMPDDGLAVSVRDNEPMKPFRLVSVIVDEPACPTGILRLVGLAVME